MHKTTSPYFLDTPTIRYRKIVQSFKQKMMFLLKSDPLIIVGDKYHNVGQTAGLTEPFDERIVKYFKKIIRNGYRNNKNLQSRGTEFVKIKYFSVRDIPLTKM